MAEQDTTKCVLPNMPALPSDAASISNDMSRYLEYHLAVFLGCDRFYLYEVADRTRSATAS